MIYSNEVILSVCVCVRVCIYMVWGLKYNKRKLKEIKAQQVDIMRIFLKKKEKVFFLLGKKTLQEIKMKRGERTNIFETK